MNRREKRLLITGIVFGVAIAVGTYEARQYFIARPKTTETLPQAVAAPEPPAPEPASGSPVAIALTPDEQKSIGVETTEVKRQTVRKEILSPGKVAEPETGAGAISARISGRIEKLFLN